MAMLEHLDELWIVSSSSDGIAIPPGWNIVSLHVDTKHVIAEYLSIIC